MNFNNFVQLLRLEHYAWEHEPKTSCRMNVYNRDGDLLIADALLDRDHVPEAGLWNDLRDREVLGIYFSIESEYRGNPSDTTPVDHAFGLVSVQIDA